MILAIDTSSAFCSVCVYNGDYHLVESRVSQSHSEFLDKTILNLINENILDLKSLNKIIVGLGPGSFTGLRIGLAFANGIALSQNLELIGYSSFQAVSMNYEQEVSIGADARNNLFFVGKYKQGNVLLEDQVINSQIDEMVELNKMEEPKISLGLIKLFHSGKKHFSGDLIPKYITKLAAKKISERY